MPHPTGSPRLTVPAPAIPPLVLASSSPYRKDLLRRLAIPFTAYAPEIDESPRPGEPPAALVLRLARAKAEALQARHPASLIIGSDQVAVCGGRLIFKPVGPEAAFAQLQSLSGQQVEFLTALALLNARSGRLQLDCVPYRVQFRTLERAQISNYLQAERPFDCAGSFKSEGLGIALFRKMEGGDPTALIGLPLIRLVAMLANEGIDVLDLAAGAGYPESA